MAGARGVVLCEIRGKERRLRVSLGAMDRVETVTGRPFMQNVVGLGDPLSTRFGGLLAMFLAFAAAGGTPLSAEEREELDTEDLEEISAAVGEVLVVAKIVDSPKEEQDEGNGKEEEDQASPPSSPGESGSNSPSES